ncbi:MAG: ATP-binding cassette domain-containing protein [Candidatus Zixiibacteriota bacterium]|nr:MAG: ATP-binding cassette domain-containing protein [candidate division Zixibacteria bacterium]
MIKLDNVTYRYRDEDQPALKSINLEIGPGESVCVMGANGSGKSTFARLLSGLLNVQQGQLKISSPRSRPIPVGMIFQNPDNQMVAVTVEKELAFALENLGYAQSDMDKLIGHNLQKFNIVHLRQRLTTELSGGEKQRVALASVMIFQPDILVLDEPESFLDEEGKAALGEELINIKKQRPSMIQIHISQYPYVASRYERLLVFDRGEVIADDAPQNILADMDLCERAGLRFTNRAGQRVVIPSQTDRGGRSGSGALGSVEVDKIRFAYSDSDYVLRNLSCTVRAGGIVGVVGPSGTGKSTLGSLICGILKPTDGRVCYLDRNGNLVDPETVAGRVSGVFQQPERQFFLPTCTEEIAFGPKNLGQRLDSQNVEALFAMAGLDADTFADRDPFTLSGGEKRRLAFAAVLSMSPDFVVFDEPTCGLDQEGVGRFILLARGLREKGVGLVIISHDGQIMRSLADSIVYLRSDAGNLVMSCDEFFENPLYRKVVSPVDQLDLPGQ